MKAFVSVIFLILAANTVFAQEPPPTFNGVDVYSEASCESDKYKGSAWSLQVQWGCYYKVFDAFGLTSTYDPNTGQGFMVHEDIVRMGADIFLSAETLSVPPYLKAENVYQVASLTRGPLPRRISMYVDCSTASYMGQGWVEGSLRDEDWNLIYGFPAQGDADATWFPVPAHDAFGCLFGPASGNPPPAPEPSHFYIGYSQPFCVGTGTTFAGWDILVISGAVSFKVGGVSGPAYCYGVSIEP